MTILDKLETSDAPRLIDTLRALLATITSTIAPRKTVPINATHHTETCLPQILEFGRTVQDLSDFAQVGSAVHDLRIALDRFVKGRPEATVAEEIADLRALVDRFEPLADLGGRFEGAVVQARNYLEMNLKKRVKSPRFEWPEEIILRMCFPGAGQQHADDEAEISEFADTPV